MGSGRGYNLQKKTCLKNVAQAHTRILHHRKLIINTKKRRIERFAAEAVCSVQCAVCSTAALRCRRGRTTVWFVLEFSRVRLLYEVQTQEMLGTKYPASTVHCSMQRGLPA